MAGNFKFDWFSIHIPNWKQWLEPFNGKPIQALEVGCFEGLATCWLLENILTNEKAGITVVDTFKGSDEHQEDSFDIPHLKKRFLDNTKAWSNKVRIVDGLSSEALRHLTGPYSVIYIDGSHYACDVLTDSCLSWEILEKDGLMIFDDYAWDICPNPEDNPRMAIDSFLASFKKHYRLVFKGYQVCICKT